MTLTSSLAFLGAMIVLALLPGPGILAVVARTLTSGIYQGVFTILGIVAGDFVFITLAIFGLSAMAELMGSLFVVVKYLGAIYLIWLGVSLWLAKGIGVEVTSAGKHTHFASFAAGLVTTLSNPKAILFYISIFPAFLNIGEVTVADAAILYSVAAIAVGGVMLGYAYAAIATKGFLKTGRRAGKLRFGAGAMLIGSGVFVATRTQ